MLSYFLSGPHITFPSKTVKLRGDEVEEKPQPDLSKLGKVQLVKGSNLEGPPVNPAFSKALDDLIAQAKRGHTRNSEFFNPSPEWLREGMRIFQDLSEESQAIILEEAKALAIQAEESNSTGRAAKVAWPDIAVRLDSGGVGFFSQLGVARRPDLTHYFVDGFPKNRDALSFSQENQALFAEVFPYITKYLNKHLEEGTTIVQTDRMVGDVPNRSFHARQLLFGTQYLQLPYMWRQLTFDLSPEELDQDPDILEISAPNWLKDLALPNDLMQRIEQSGLTQLVFKAPTRGLSLHLGFDYLGEHKMGPLSIAMFKTKEAGGLAVQAALSVARIKTLQGDYENSALITLGPSLHGKSTLTIMIELTNSPLGKLLGTGSDPAEGIYPMNDDILLLQPLDEPIQNKKDGKTTRISYSIDGTENNFYAVPVGLTRDDDPITYDVLRGDPKHPNPQETLENVPTDPLKGHPDFNHNPVRNMRMILSRSRLLARKNAEQVLHNITQGESTNAVHVPMAHMDRLLWQGVMRQNTVIPPLVRLNLNQYVCSLMYGEAVQTGAAAGAIGRPYVEYFSDPFIIGLEDDNANLMLKILNDLQIGGLQQEFYMFNTGGVGADSNEQATGEFYKKIPRELTLTLQEALLRRAVKFERDPLLGVDVAVAIMNHNNEEIQDLRGEWLPKEIYGEDNYNQRLRTLKRKRYYGESQEDKSGILRYTKAINTLLDLSDIPEPESERELAWLLSFFWDLDQAYQTIAEVTSNLGPQSTLPTETSNFLQQMFDRAIGNGLPLTGNFKELLVSVGISA